MIEQYVTSFLDGRVRLRHPALKHPEQAAEVRTFLEAVPGMLSVSGNVRTGSLLLCYDPSLLSREELVALAEGWSSVWTPMPTQPAPQALSASRRYVRRANMVRLTNRGMIATLGASVAFAVAGRMVGHIATGSLFLGLNLVHLYLFRKKL